MTLAELSARAVSALRGIGERIGLIGAWRPPAAVDPESSESIWTNISSRGRYSCTDVAHQIVSGKIPVFTKYQTFEYGAPRWNIDPDTGVQVSNQFGKHIHLEKTSEVGSIKYVWEVNRHLSMPLLVRAYLETRDETYAQCIAEHIATWLSDCPYPKGPNWASSLEAGIRLINWSIAWECLREKRGGQRAWRLDSSLREQLLDSVYQHAHFIRHHYSRFSSANNHLIGEAAGLYVAACTWPFWKQFEKWRVEAKRLLVEAIELQTCSDGVNREQAIAYQQFVLDFFVLAGLAGRACGDEFPETYWKSIEQMLEYLQSVIDVGCNVPMIGDSDDGVVVRLTCEPGFCPYRSLLATGAILFDRPDFAVTARELDDKTRCLVGEGDWDRILRRGREFGSPPASRKFPEGGYYILGQRIGQPDEIRLLVDAGPLGYLSIAAHGHADALAVYLSVGGQEFLIDPGTYTYAGQPLWREWFRGTRAHNAMTVDKQDQSVQGGDFIWLKHARVRCLEFKTDDKQDQFEAEHDGYQRLADPVCHRRKIVRDGGVFRITDTLVCKGRHKVDAWWHFSERCDVHRINDAVEALNGNARIRLRPDTGTLQLYRGSEDPVAGWVSRRFDVKEPTTSVCVSHEIEGTSILRTTIECKVS